MPGFEEDRDYFNPDGTANKKSVLNGATPKVASDALSFAKVFLYMFMYLAITAVVAFGVSYLINHFYQQSVAAGGTGEEVLMPYLYAMIAAIVVLLILGLIINFVVIRGKRSVLIPSIIYSIVMGGVLSFVVIFVDNWTLIGMAFGITSGVFLLMGLIALVSKGNFAPLGMLALGLLLGSGILALTNFFLQSEMIYWIVSFAIFAAIMFITMFDIWNVKKIVTSGAEDKNISYYCAFIIYLDFIRLFIRILYYLAIIFAKRK